MGRFYAQSASAVPAEVAIAANLGGGTDTKSAIQYGGYLYIGSVEGSAGDVGVTIRHETTGAVVRRTLHAALEIDWHDAPALEVLPNGRLITAYCKHASGSPEALYIRISTNTLASDPTISGGWGVETNIDASLGGTQYTYPSFHWLGSTLYLVYRNYGAGTPDVKWCYSTSADNGATWAAQTVLFQSRAIDYLRVDGTGSRLDFVTDSGVSNTDKPYHFYMTTGGRFRSDGVAITALPMAITDLTEIATSGGGATAIKSGSNPVIVVSAYSGGTTSFTYARWTGSSWSVQGAPFTTFTYSGEAWGQWGGLPSFASASTIYVSKPVSGTWEIVRYRTTDNGATWVEDQISAAADDAFSPVVVRNASKTVLVWNDGTASSYTSYSLDIMGATV